MTSPPPRGLMIALACAAAVVAAVAVVVRLGIESGTALIGLALALAGALAAFARFVHTRPAPPPGRRRADTAAWIAAGAAALMLVTAGVVVLLPGRPQPAPTAATPEPPLRTGSGTLRILAGASLISDLGPVLADAERRTGVRIELTEQAGTLAAVDDVLSGRAVRSHDAIWLPSNSYLALQPGAVARVAAAKPIAQSPVVLGLRASLATSFGWDDRPPTWADIAEKAAAGGFTFGMTNPAASNSGYGALVGVTAALADSRGPLTVAQIDRERGTLRRFFDANTLTSGSTGWLSEAFLDRIAKGAPVDGLITYEAELIKLNESGSLPEPLTLIFPANGQLVADYPLTLLAGASDQARVNYEALVDYLTRESTQRQIAERTRRRPVVEGVVPATPFDPARLEPLAFPDRADVATRLLTDFGDQWRKRARTIYLLDVSGSMIEPPEKLAALQTTLRGLAGADTTLAGLYARFNLREQVHLIPFSDEVRPGRRVDLAGDLAAGQREIIAFADALTADGATALYDALLTAYELADRLDREEPGLYTSIVLLTDGEKTAGRSLETFERRHAQLSSARTVPTFTVLFGDSRAEADMDRVAALTGGRRFDARRTPLSTVFKEVRGFQ